jgi:pimeloyl-ACP methyl ester carboxylesterase
MQAHTNNGTASMNETLSLSGTPGAPGALATRAHALASRSPEGALSRGALATKPPTSTSSSRPVPSPEGALARGALATLAALALAAPALAASGCAAGDTAGDTGEDTAASEEQLAGGAVARDVLLVHGAWADGSSWADVTARLQRDGYAVRAVQLPLQSLAGDAAIVRREIERIGRPVVVAGHSYGGAVITEAAAGASNVTGLVYAAAYSLDEGESLGALNARFPATPILGALQFDSAGNATVEPEAFTQLFAPDLEPRRARVLAATQGPISGAIFGTPGTAPAWRTIRSWYQVSALDQVIDPDLQRFVAARMGARVIELPSSHASPLAYPGRLAALIETAAHAR